MLFSGGLDSILAAKVLQEQGLKVRCLHCVSPFFGDAAAVPRWSARYGLDIAVLDVSEDFATLLRRRPEHGFGKVMNPCVDCKILLLRHARLYMEAMGARVLATGEVLGQRPMSQRRDTLHLIMREAGVSGLLLRPLCALHLSPTLAEESGLVDRERLLGISGRGRKDQLELAGRFKLAEIPTPGGGCRLTERENARRYWSVLTRLAAPTARDFALANLGRQFWREADGCWHWLCVGRNSADNERLAAAAGPDDIMLRLRDLPGPQALARNGASWPAPVLEEAACLAASYAPKAAAADEPVIIRARRCGESRELLARPRRVWVEDAVWGEAAWDEVKAALREEARQEREKQEEIRREKRDKAAARAAPRAAPKT